MPGDGRALAGRGGGRLTARPTFTSAVDRGPVVVDVEVVGSLAATAQLGASLGSLH